MSAGPARSRYARCSYQEESHLSNAAAVPDIPDVDISSFVFERVSEHSDKPALIDGPSGRTVTYGQLQAMSGVLAGALATRGIGKGDAVCIYLPNLPEYAVIFHGVNRAGGVNTTANPLYGAREVNHQLHDSGAKMLFTIPMFLEVAREAVKGTDVREIVLLGGEGSEEGVTQIAELLGSGAEPPGVQIDPARDLAVLPYSSGTTGLPKGVMLTHRNLVANIVQTNAAMPMEPDDVVIGVLPFFHIYGMTVIMNMGLWHGATIVTMPRFDLGQFLELISKHSVTGAYVVPPIALALAKHPAVGEADLSSLRFIMSGAAPLGPELTDQVASRLDVPVTQGYGMTELSPVSHFCPLDSIKPGSIGPEIPGTESRIVDPESGEDVGPGERGELWVRGPQVMVGYLNNEEATKETITEDGWLRTGDIAVVDEDGFYSIVDRLKELIKYKGFQVPPAELEAILIGHPAVADCAVIGVPDEEAGELPKGFVVIAEGAEVSDEELLEHVAGQVSPQKKLRMIERIDAIPKSASGKILRRELRDG
jgi:acyl-CoA synthetase (AMP-forming)/AMP-acid ligase II